MIDKTPFVEPIRTALLYLKRNAVVELIKTALVSLTAFNKYI
jgi:hypothetical protein